MSLAARLSERFSKRLKRLVERERKITGCGTTAAKRVASKIGMSVATMYRAMNCYGEVQIKAHHYVALLMLSMGSKAAKSKFCNAAKSVGAKFSRGRRIFTPENLAAP